jgi:hypothetical protein
MRTRPIDGDDDALFEEFERNSPTRDVLIAVN